jgi:hypothetical protein
MTTVAVKWETERGWVMAADSRIGDGESHITRCQKIFLLPSGALIGEAGDADARPMRELLGDVKTARAMPPRQRIADMKCDFVGLLLLKNGELWRIESGRAKKHDDWEGQLYEIKDKFAAIGSGSPYALGAMMAGANALKACTIAGHFDFATGGPFSEVCLKDVAKRRAR